MEILLGEVTSDYSDRWLLWILGELCNEWTCWGCCKHHFRRWDGPYGSGVSFSHGEGFGHLVQLWPLRIAWLNLVGLLVLQSGSAMEKDGEKMYALLVSPSMLLFDTQKHREHKELSRSIQTIGNPVPNSSACISGTFAGSVCSKASGSRSCSPSWSGKGSIATTWRASLKDWKKKIVTIF